MRLFPLPTLTTFNSPLSLSLSLFLRRSPKMALTAHRNRLRSFIQSMHDEGIVNDQFCELQYMKEVIGRDYVVRVITRFCVACIGYQQQVDFQKVHVLARELYARTTSVGAENVRRASAELLYASDMKDKDHCYRALYWIKNEFSYLRRKLETLVQLERRIIDLENML